MPAKNLRFVLYVDDDPDICTVVQAALSATADLEVATATSGGMAIDMALEEPPDLMLMDVLMPELDGPSTLIRMREHAPLVDIPAIFLTAKAMPAEVTQFLALGVIGVICKPFDPMRLAGDVSALWQNKRATGT